MSAFLETLAKWAKSERRTTRPRRNETLVIFLAVRDDVKAAIDAGYAIKTIWEHMHETNRVSFRYETFLRYVHRHIKNAPQVSPIQPATAKRASLAKGDDETRSKASGTPKRTEAPALSSFTFNSKPNKEDLF